MILGEKMKSYESHMYFVFRMLIGLLFMQHGLQKLFGMFGGIGGGSVELISLMGLAGLIELLGGLGIALGFFTRLFALIAGVEMLAAFFTAHAPNGLIPLVNKGELALLYFAAFLVLLVSGAGKWALENAVLKKETF